MTSNDCLGIAEPDRPHPLREMVDTGLFCTINSEDPPMFGSSLKQLPDFRLRSQSRQLRAFVVRLADEDGEVVGHIAISPVSISDGSKQWYGLGPVSVSPQRQRQGIGSKLMQRALDELRQLGAAGCVVLGDPDFYGRFGFKAVPDLILPGVPPEYFQAVSFGTATPAGEVAYHAAFNAETMTEYIFERNDSDQELARLQLIEEAVDPTTIMHLKSTGLPSGARCLELGAGAGSIMTWMGSVVGASGRVVGIDRDTKHLQHLTDPRFQVLAGDFLDVKLDELFDLAHCRYVLIHNRTSAEILAKLCKLLRPGGYLVIEEPDFTSAKLLNRTGDTARHRVNSAICRMFENLGLNPAYGLQLPQKVAAAGLQVIATDSQLHLARGGSPMGRMMAASQQALAAKLVATGEVTEAEVEEYVRDSRDAESWAVYYCTVSVVALNPA